MALIKPVGKLIYSDPGKNYVKQMGASATLRPNKNWELARCEYLEPIGAIAPRGKVQWIGMGSSNFTPVQGYGPFFREVRKPGKLTDTWVEHYGTNVTEGPFSLIDLLVLIVSLIPTNLVGPSMSNFSLSISKFSEDNYTLAYISRVLVKVPCQLQTSLIGGKRRLDKHGTWSSGHILLSIPLYPVEGLQVCLGAIIGSSNSEILSYSPFMELGETTSGYESWTFEVVEDAARFPGTHFLIRKTGQAGWWHTYHPCIKSVGGNVNLIFGGTNCAVNLSPLIYSYSGETYGTYECAPDKNGKLPNGEWASLAKFGNLGTVPTGWSITNGNYYGGTAGEEAGYYSLNAGEAYKPKWAFEPTMPSLSTRPILWLGQEEHATVFADAPNLVADDTTEGDKALTSITWTQDYTWRAGKGKATFKPSYSERYTDWREGGKLDVYCGWQTGAGTGLVSQLMAKAYITANGLRRARIGSERAGIAQMSLEFGDLWNSRAQDNCMVDFGQAGGMTVGNWARHIGNRLGVPTADIHIDAAVENMLIPCAATPSEPNFDPQDGEEYADHIKKVEQACNIRVGSNSTYTMFVDAGAAVWTPGTSTPHFTLDYNTVTEQDKIKSITVEPSGKKYRNSIKGVYGPKNSRETLYWAATDAIRAWDGIDRWGYVEDNSGVLTADAMRRKVTDEFTQEQWMSWEGHLRPGIAPDQFILIADCPNVKLTVGDVYQIKEVSYSVSTDAASSSMTVKAKLVCQASNTGAGLPPVGNELIGWTTPGNTTKAKQ